MSKTITTAEDRLKYIQQDSLPKALDTLSSQHESLGKVVQYLESQYLFASELGHDKTKFHQESKEYLVKALYNVTTNINVIANSLDQVLEIQGNAIDSLTSQVASVKSELLLTKENHDKESLFEMRNPRNSHLNLNSKTIFKPSPSIIISKESDNRSYPPVEKYSIEKRLQILDNVGININNNSSISIIYKDNNLRSRHLIGRYNFHKTTSLSKNDSEQSTRNASINSEVRRKSQIGLAGTARNSFLSGISSP